MDFFFVRYCFDGCLQSRRNILLIRIQSMMLNVAHGRTDEQDFRVYCHPKSNLKMPLNLNGRKRTHVIQEHFTAGIWSVCLGLSNQECGKALFGHH